MSPVPSATRPWRSSQARVAKRLLAEQGKLRAELPQLEKALATARADCEAHKQWHVCRVALASPRPAELLLGGGGALHIHVSRACLPMRKLHVHRDMCTETRCPLTHVRTGVISLTLHLPCSAPAGCVLAPSPDGAGLLVQHVGDGPGRVAGLVAGDVVTKAVLKEKSGSLLHEASAPALDAMGAMMQLAPDAALREFLEKGPLVFGADQLVELPALDKAFHAFCADRPGRRYYSHSSSHSYSDSYSPLSARGFSAGAFAARGLRVVSATPLAELEREEEERLQRRAQLMTQMLAQTAVHNAKMEELQLQLEGPHPSP